MKTPSAKEFETATAALRVCAKPGVFPSPSDREACEIVANWLHAGLIKVTIEAQTSVVTSAPNMILEKGGAGLAEARALIEKAEATLLQCISAGRRLNEQVEKQDEEIEWLREGMGQIEYIDAGGCLDGDCPHDHANECLTVLTAELRLVGETVRGLLGEPDKSAGEGSQEP